MKTKIVAMSILAALTAACSPAEPIIDYWVPPTASSTASAAPAPTQDLDRVRDLLVGTWVRTEEPAEVWDRYLPDGTRQTVDFSGRVVNIDRWELVTEPGFAGGTIAALQTEGDPRTRMLIGAIDWEAMTLSIPNRGTSYHYTRVRASMLRGWYGGHGRGLTIRADGTGTGYYKDLCDESGVNCIENVSYGFVLQNEVAVPGAEVMGPGAVMAEQRITGVRPASAYALVSPEKLRLDLEADIISTAPTFDDAAFCGARARPSACGA
ncbi:hypothetical protein [Tsukamurella paurometabola]|uniref:Lipoprotein n=1 Tax=Tsukamurella paurometabola TaxID=2061 RepID=A0ABS5NJK3_TSUPA|nr:hypothetical protein [Tsukamurella paurometabola]MBS4104477.1 hypothetical protein [Tsukamurella paurometabola]